MSAAGSIMGGEGQAKADEFQAQQLENAAQYGRTQAAQVGYNMTTNMTRMLGHIAAVRASLGSDVRSPSTWAVMGNQEAQAERERAIRMGSIFAQVRQDQMGAQQYTDMASRALQGGYLGALGDVAKGLGGAFSSMGSSFNFFGGASGGGGVQAPSATVLPVSGSYIVNQDPLTGRGLGPV
jgi:hypothetical protein